MRTTSAGVVGHDPSLATATSTPAAIPFNKPAIMGRELYYISQAIHNGHSAGDGSFTKRCQEWLQRELGVGKALLTTSCTDALEMAALLLDISPGDEVIVPSFTFVSTANAFVAHGARPVFADIRPDTLNIDESLLEDLITPRTKAIVPVHYGGVGCEMDVICDIAARHGIPIIEDNAHGLLSTYKGRYLGTFGQLGTQSFHETKNFMCGEGGALIVNDPRYVSRAEIIREKGTNRSRFFRGEVDKYTWVDVGSSYLPSDLLAAFLLAQLEEKESIQARRKAVWERYLDALGPWALRNDVTLPTVPAHCQQAYHLFYMVMPSAESRTALIAHLRERDIKAVFHYLPLHDSPMGRRFGPAECPVTTSVSERLVRLPFYNELSEADQARIINAIESLPLHYRAPSTGTRR